MPRWVETETQQNGERRYSLWARNAQGINFRVKEKDNPAIRVREYEKAIRNLYCPRLRLKGLVQQEYTALITAGVVLPFATTKGTMELLKPFHSGKAFHPIVGGDALEAGLISKVFPESQRRFSRFMDDSLANDLRSWLIDPDHAAVQREPLELDSKQRQFADSTTTQGYRKIKGPAGSGKSLVLAARAARCAAEGRNVLVVTFNITLWHYLRDLAVRHRIPETVRFQFGRHNLNDKIQWKHFHEWCKDICYEAGLEIEYRSILSVAVAGKKLDVALEVEIPALVERALNSGTIKGNHDAILVDEGQDFNLEWWNLLRKVLSPKGEMLLIADHTQDIYAKTKSWTDHSLKGAGFKNGSWGNLGPSYRMPPNLMPYVREYATKFLPTVEPNLPYSPNTNFDPEFYPIDMRWLQVNYNQVEEACVEAIEEIVRASKIQGDPNVAFSDVTFLVDSHEVGLECVKQLGEKGIKVAHVFGDNYQQKHDRKLAFWMGDARIKGATIHSFKGWEARAIILCITQANDLQALSSIYVGMTRLKRHTSGSFIKVICADPRLAEYGRTWPGT